MVRAAAITPEPVAGRAGHGVHRVAEDAQLVHKEWAGRGGHVIEARKVIVGASKAAPLVFGRAAQKPFATIGSSDKPRAVILEHHAG